MASGKKKTKLLTAVAMALSAEFQASFWRLQCKPCLRKVEFPNTRGFLLPHEQTENIGEGESVDSGRRERQYFQGRGKK